MEAAEEIPKAAQSGPLGMGEGGRGEERTQRLVLGQGLVSGAGEENLTGDCYRCY